MYFVVARLGEVFSVYVCETSRLTLVVAEPPGLPMSAVDSTHDCRAGSSNGPGHIHDRQNVLMKY